MADKNFKSKKINLGKVINDVDKTNDHMPRYKSGPH
jgi:hypothetical protein